MKQDLSKEEIEKLRALDIKIRFSRALLVALKENYLQQLACVSDETDSTLITHQFEIILDVIANIPPY